MPRPEQLKYTGALLQTLQGDAMDHRLSHGHAAHLTDLFVVPETEFAERCRVQLVFQPFKYERRAEEAVAKRSERLGGLLVRASTVVVV
jgi:hypothetical protein